MYLGDRIHALRGKVQGILRLHMLVSTPAFIINSSAKVMQPKQVASSYDGLFRTAQEELRESAARPRPDFTASGIWTLQAQQASELQTLLFAAWNPSVFQQKLIEEHQMQQAKSLGNGSIRLHSIFGIPP